MKIKFLFLRKQKKRKILKRYILRNCTINTYKVYREYVLESRFQFSLRARVYKVANKYRRNVTDGLKIARALALSGF